MEQLKFDELTYPKFKITRPVRLIELFAGYGSQALALKYLNIPFEHWKICEWSVKSIQAYKDIHFTDLHKDIYKTKEEMVEYLYEKGISSNYNEPMSKKQIERLSGDELKTICENIELTHNLVNVEKVSGVDLEICDADKFDYILSYSFPCQDLSLAGKQAGMAEGTRSGMLWQVERILKECKQIEEKTGLKSRPQVLLMENVIQVHGKRAKEDFNRWCDELKKLGYRNYWKDLMATDYGIPQTRKRTFMISVLGDYSFSFPEPLPLKLKLKDLLEDEVDASFYLSEKQINDIKQWKAYEKPLEKMEETDRRNVSPTLTTRTSEYTSSLILIKDAARK